MSTYLSAHTQLRDADLKALGSSWNARSALEAPAQARWVTLRAMSSNADEQELRAAGVNERRIGILYEPSFEDLVPQLIAIIDVEHYRHLDGSEEWEKREHGIRYLYRQIRGQTRGSDADMALAEFANSTSGWSLRDHILSCLPESEDRLRRASAMTQSLWCAHEIMVSAKEQEGSLEELHYQFTTVCDWVAPWLGKVS